MEFFEVEDLNSIRKITISNPKKKNALNRRAYVALAELLHRAGCDDKIKCVLLTGKGEFYSSGNDLTQSIDGDPNEQDILRKPIDALVKSFINFPKILICLINGPCIGITATTMALADIAYCHESAYFYTPFTALGLCAEGCSSYLFPAILGSSKANELLSLNHRLTAEEAYQFGLVAKVYKNESEIWEKLRQIDDLPLGSIMANKRLVRAGRAKMLEEIHNEEVNELTKRFETEEAIEAMIKFQMKRKSKL